MSLKHYRVFFAVQAFCTGSSGLLGFGKAGEHMGWAVVHDQTDLDFYKAEVWIISG